MSILRTISASSPLIAKLIASALDRPEADAGMKNVHAWVGLRDLIGAALRVDDILSNVGALHRDETIFTLSRIAGDLANSPGGVLGPEARAWTRDLLLRGASAPSALQRAIAHAVDGLPPERTIAHAHVLFALQVLAAVRGSTSVPPPHDNYLAFMMLAVNDYLPEWQTPTEVEMSSTERSLSAMFLSSAFNRSDASLRLLLRTVEIMGSEPSHGTFTTEQWAKIQEEAFGVSFAEYAEAFLAPMFLLSKGWGFKTTPLVFPEEWVTGERAKLYERWLDEASVPVEVAVQTFAERSLPSGLFGLTPAFFRTPFLRIDGKLVGLSPWHVRDHATLGTWAKLNAASKRVLNTSSNQAFASAFGYFFENWCARIAREAADAAPTSERLVLPSKAGATDEIEDVVFQDGNLVVLMSVKASLVPEASLKTADSANAPVEWLRKFFFEDVAQAKGKGYRGGVVLLAVADECAAFERNDSAEVVTYGEHEPLPESIAACSAHSALHEPEAHSSVDRRGVLREPPSKAVSICIPQSERIGRGCIDPQRVQRGDGNFPTGVLAEPPLEPARREFHDGEEVVVHLRGPQLAVCFTENGTGIPSPFGCCRQACVTFAISRRARSADESSGVVAGVEHLTKPDFASRSAPRKTSQHRVFTTWGRPRSRLTR